MEADFDLANLQLKKIMQSHDALLAVQVVPFLLLIYLQSKVMWPRLRQCNNHQCQSWLYSWQYWLHDSSLLNMSGHLGTIDGTLSSMNSTTSSQLGGMQNSLAAIKGMTQTGVKFRLGKFW